MKSLAAYTERNVLMPPSLLFSQEDNTVFIAGRSFHRGEMEQFRIEIPVSAMVKILRELELNFHPRIPTPITLAKTYHQALAA